MIRGIIFDCFGVLYVKAGVAYFAQFPEHHDELHDLNVRADHGFIDRQEYISEVSRITGIPPTETEQAFAREHTLNHTLIEGIRRSLKPHYKIGLLSNIGRDWLQDLFDEYQLHDLFDAVVMSSEEGITKPNPLIFERAAEKLGVSPDECLMIDDTQENCNGAETAGMKSLRYDSMRMGGTGGNRVLFQFIKALDKEAKQ